MPAQNYSQTNNKRERLIDAAAELFHQKGLTTTSLSDIAGRANIPIGNVYYYFKTKDELALAAIEKRRALLTAAYQSLQQSVSDPRRRLIEALLFFENVKEEYTRHGCPLGRLIAELNPKDDPAAALAALTLQEFTDWAAAQFAVLGHTEQADNLAQTLLAGIQGAAIIAKSASDSARFSGEMRRLIDWIENIPNQRVHLGKVAFAPS